MPYHHLFSFWAEQIVQVSFYRITTQTDLRSIATFFYIFRNNPSLPLFLCKKSRLD